MHQLSLYKYIPFEAPLLTQPNSLQQKRHTCFENGEIWYSQATKLNDPFDCKPRLHLPVCSEEQLEELVNSLSSDELRIVEEKTGLSTKEDLLILLKTPNVMKLPDFPGSKHAVPVDFIHQSIFVGALSAIFSANLSSIGVLSLTEDPFNLKMWAHYGGNSTGICLEFERTAANTLGSKSTQKIKYVKERPKIMLHERHDHLVEVINTKSHIWEHEKEWRDIKSKGDKSYPFPGKIQRVLFGVNCHKTTVELTKNIFGTGIKYEEMLLNEDYSLRTDNGLKHSLSQVDIKWDEGSICERKK